jgi:hypothetical protein|tara:strand:+ start:442 stop:1290 length:849 start_codon:yes stop_codon:yes gene_type:complete
MVDGPLKAYRHYREYTKDEIRSEQDEYFENDATKKALPNLFRDRDDVTYHVKDAPLELLDRGELNRLQNSDAKEILSEPTQKARMLATLRLMKHYGKNYKSLYRAFAKREKLPPPLVVRDKNDDLYLLAGNSRIMMAIAFGFNMPVKSLKFSKKIVRERKYKRTDLLTIAIKIANMYGVRSKLRFKSGTGNKADYDWVKDIITLDPKPDNILDFIESVLHEIDHARMRKKYGANKYEKEYTIAGQLMVDKGKDFYWDNPFEKQAEDFAKREAKKIYKKLNFK